MATKRRAAESGRDAGRTREALIDAARWLLTRHGYDQLGTRDIAGRAGVDAALVQRYFGSKKKLFEAAIGNAFEITQHLRGVTRERLAAHLATLMVDAQKDRARFDPTLVLLRSVASAEVHKVLARTLEDDFIRPMAEQLGGHGARTRAAMMLAILGGFDLVRSVLGNDALDAPETRRLLERVLEACVRE